jgi:BASS family bile acid:Na+ symporter
MKLLLDVLAPALTFGLFVAVGLDLTQADFARVRRKPTLVLTGLLAPLVILPLIAFGVIEVFRPAPQLAFGMVLLAVCPIGGISNTYSYLARASTSLSVTLTGLSCVAASITIPLVSQAIKLLLGQSFDFEAPVAYLTAYGVVVLALPMALGMWIRLRTPSLVLRHKLTLQRLVFAGVVVLIVLVIMDDPGAFADELSTAVPLSAAFVVAALIAGWAMAILVTADDRDRFTVATEFATRNVGVATAIAVTILGRVEFARFGITYFMTEAPMMLIIAAAFRRRRAARGFNDE